MQDHKFSLFSYLVINKVQNLTGDRNCDYLNVLWMLVDEQSEPPTMLTLILLEAATGELHTRERLLIDIGSFWFYFRQLASCQSNENRIRILYAQSPWLS